MSDPHAFNTEVIEQTAAAVRLAFPEAAALIESLWAEVQRLTAPEHVNPVPMTKADKEGPFLEKPEVDVEFFDVTGHACGSCTVELGIRLNDRGILIISETYATCHAERRMTIGGYRVWLGNDVLETLVDAVTLGAGDTYALALNVPVRLGRGIGHNPDGRDGPPRPMPPSPVKKTQGA